MGITEALKKARLRRGWSQEELANRLNRSRTSVTKIENGHQSVTLTDAIEWFKHTNAQDIFVTLLISMDPAFISEGLNMVTKLVGMVFVFF